jgi:hypothetical protein
MLGTVDKKPQYFFFPYLSQSCSQGYRFTTHSMTALDFHFGGKEAFRKLFSIVTPNNVCQCLLAYGAAMSAFYGRVIRTLYGQCPIIVLLSEEKGLGKTFLLKQCLWAVSHLSHVYNNATTAEYVLSKASSTTLLIGKYRLYQILG